QLDGLHSPEAADVTNLWPLLLPFECANTEPLSMSVGASWQIQSKHRVDGCNCRLTGQRISPKRPADRAGAWRIHDLGSPGDRSNRQPSAKRFRGNQNIGFNSV